MTPLRLDKSECELDSLIRHALVTSPSRASVMSPAPDPKRWRARLAAALSVFAALRIFLFAAAFPLFNNTDEKFHFATIALYAHGRFPGRELPLIGDDLANALAPHASPEYWATPESKKYWATLESMDRGDRPRLPGFFARENFEAQGPPLYYVVAAAWYKLGAALGIQDGPLLYWVRFLNPLAYGFLVWLSYLFVRRVYPENSFLCVAVPALIAVFPQDVFFGMNRDVLSPALWAGALLLMVDAIAGEKTGARSLTLASLLVGLGFLLELSNCILYVALLSAMWLWLHRPQASARQKVWIAILSLTAALLPPFLWMRRNYLVMGNLTGTKAKVEYLGWSVKPLRDVFHHPLFSSHGLVFFLSNLTTTFWCGEYRWHGFLMQSSVADRFYLLSTAAMLLIFVQKFARRRRVITSLQRWVAWQALLAVAGSVLFLAAISVIFDFHNSGYPSQTYPYFASGRIIAGVLLPFALMYAGGLEVIARWLRRSIPPGLLLACLLLLITVSEIRVRSAVFSSPYNFFVFQSRR